MPHAQDGTFARQSITWSNEPLSSGLACNGSLPLFSSPDQLKNSKWSKYFESVYGEIPQSGYPICVGDFRVFYSEELKAANISLPEHLHSCPPSKDEARKSSYWEYAREGGPPQSQIGVYHFVPWKPFGDNEWVEVTRRQRTWDSGFERQGAWFGYSKGSGMWTNLGKTISFDTHTQGFEFFRATWENDMATNAAALGYDTIQFLRGDGVSTDPCCEALELGPCCHSFEFVSVKLQGTYGCAEPPGGTSIMAGWSHSRPCNCDENAVRFISLLNTYVSALNCEDVPPRKPNNNPPLTPGPPLEPGDWTTSFIGAYMLMFALVVASVMLVCIKRKRRVLEVEVDAPNPPEIECRTLQK